MALTPIFSKNIVTLGGIKRIKIAPWVKDVIKLDDFGNIAEFLPGANFIEFGATKKSSELRSSANLIDKRVESFTSTLSVKFPKIKQFKSNIFDDMAFEHFMLLVTDANDVTWFLGEDTPVTLDGLTMATGVGFSDLNGYTLSFSTTSFEQPRAVVSDYVPGRVLTINSRILLFNNKKLTI